MKYSVEPPRVEQFGPLFLAGLCRSHRLPRDGQDLFHDISKQWRDFSTMRQALRPVTNVEYGVGLQMADGSESLDYCCAVPVSPDAELPSGIVRLAFPQMRCAVFPHTDHISKLRQTMELIFGTLLPKSRLEPAGNGSAPEFIERYNKDFSPDTGLGGLEVLIPLKSSEA